ncbi:hypothetical protein P3T18_004097 [Paraburkholderia sp. GAS199]|uniref:hypothetical protein n=1 Tax=Paraburkholderia sp. GAS199 TaxID=3035126 RepID=UPI003D261DBE
MLDVFTALLGWGWREGKPLGYLYDLYRYFSFSHFLVFLLFACGGGVSFLIGFCCLPAAALFLCVIGLLVLPLCGAALTFFAAAKKGKQRKPLTPLTLSGHLS